MKKTLLFLVAIFVSTAVFAQSPPPEKEMDPGPALVTNEKINVSSTFTVQSLGRGTVRIFSAKSLGNVAVFDFFGRLIARYNTLVNELTLFLPQKPLLAKVGNEIVKFSNTGNFAASIPKAYVVATSPKTRATKQTRKQRECIFYTPSLFLLLMCR
ncbi:MAG: hypothetical protein LBL58_04585 [Tannerellaceae bacterium]|jgi:hypothetical protein|nr:hypothetical protein [Tannerellaceae bacterium]